MLAELTRDAAPQTAQATPLGAFVELVRTCGSVADVKKKCEELVARSV